MDVPSFSWENTPVGEWPMLGITQLILGWNSVSRHCWRSVLLGTYKFRTELNLFGPWLYVKVMNPQIRLAFWDIVDHWSMWFIHVPCRKIDIYRFDLSNNMLIWGTCYWSQKVGLSELCTCIVFCRSVWFQSSFYIKCVHGWCCVSCGRVRRTVIENS